MELLFSPFRLVCAGLCAAFLAGAADTLRAQGSAEVDPSFFAPTDGRVLALAAQPDGKIIIGGNFNEVDGLLRPHLARLHPDGSLDANFVSVVGIVESLLVQPDGKIIFTSDVPQTDASPLAHVGRLNPDGSLDTGFTSPPDGPSGRFVLRQTDGKLLVAGDVVGGGVSVVRLNPDGRTDSSYASVFDPGATLTAACLQGDGKLVTAAPNFDGTGYTQTMLVRFNVDGSRDAGFSAYTNPGVYSLAALPDGRLLACGNFNYADGFLSGNVARFEADGAVDTGFRAGFAGDFAFGDLIAPQPDGKVLFVGGFGHPTHLSFNRFGIDGTADPAFPPQLDTVYPGALLVESDHSVLIAGPGGVERVIDSALFFRGEVALGNGVNYLTLLNGNEFGYYAVLSDPRYIYHFGLGYEYVFDSNDGTGGVYFYDFASGHFFYTSPTFPFPYLYDFTLQAVLYYYPSLGSPTPPNVRYFYNFTAGGLITL